MFRDCLERTNAHPFERGASLWKGAALPGPAPFLFMRMRARGSRGVARHRFVHRRRTRLPDLVTLLDGDPAPFFGRFQRDFGERRGRPLPLMHRSRKQATQLALRLWANRARQTPRALNLQTSPLCSCHW